MHAETQLRLPTVGDIHHEYAPTTTTRSLSEPRSYQPDPGELTDAGLLTTLLGPSTERACEALTATYGSLRRLSQAHPADLRDQGLKPATLRQLSAVFELASRYAAVLFVYNYPSGDATPSREDLEITRRLRDVGELVGVRVLDHIIIGNGRFVSFVDDGYW